SELFISCETTSDVSASLFATGRSSWKITAGIDELSELKLFKAYPNPVSDRLTIETLSSIESVELTGTDGHSCFVYTPASLQIKVTINLSEMSLADGLYTLRIKTGSRLYYKKLLLIKT
ncbi:MAG: T9SS type A sorting domain-containing protein, partial [Bacteroidia bacterium]